jgi:hypothetical protein
MSVKNRAFALAIATAALVGFAAPVASAASAASNPSGFNNDSIANVSGNQVPIQACNNDVPVNAGVLAGQLGLSDISALLGLVNSGLSTTTDGRTCMQTPSQMDSSTTTTNSTSTHPSGGNNNGGNNNGGNNNGGNNNGGNNNSPASHGSTNTSGFNNDSVLNVSNNQVPVQACNNDVPVNAGLGAVQVVGAGLSVVGGLLGNSGHSTVNDDRTCTQTPTQDNTTSITPTSSSS